MKHIKVNVKKGFHVIAETKRSQAATMAIVPGESEGGPDNYHDADQWLFVLEGEGHAVVEQKKISIQQGSLLQITAGEKHEIINDSEQVLKTLNIYAPPEY